MDRSLARYIWKHTRAQQIWILIVVAVSMYTYYLSFDLPKLIVNGPIQGKGFETATATKTFLHLAFNVPGLGHVELFPGIALGRFWSLMYLCTVFLLLVIVNGAFKFYINTYKGRLGERMLRRIRFELVDQVLRFPPVQFKRVKPAEIASMVKDEVEPLGGFIGDAFVQPALLGGQALTAMVFIMIQNTWLGLISTGIVAIQIIVIPKMRRRLLRLGRERQLTARELAGRIGEISEGIATIHAHDTSNYERAEISARLGRIFKIRYDLYQWKFLVKFLNNFLAQVTPFLFYAIGGYMVIVGRLDIGQLVAVIAAYKDLPAPLKDLIDWDQIRQDVNIKYMQVYEQFTVDGMMAPHLQAPDAQRSGPLNAPLAAVNLSVTDDSGAKLLERTSMALKPGETVAIVGSAGSGGEALAEAFARLVQPDSGKVNLGADNIFELPESITGRRISYASFDAYLMQGSLRDNLFYSLKHAPLRPADYDGALSSVRQWEAAEARKSGNLDFDINSDWIDYEAAGATGPEDILTVLLPVLDAVHLSADFLDLGLRSSANPVRHPQIAGRILEIRQAFRKQLELENLGELVVPFDPGVYNLEATVGENLVFGAMKGVELADSELAAARIFRPILKATDLEEPLYNMGLAIAANAVELFGDLPPDHPFFQQLTFMPAERVPEFQALLPKLQGRDYASVSDESRSKIIALSLGYIEPRHRFGLLDSALAARIVAARAPIREAMPREIKDSIQPYDSAQYNVAANLLDNVLFGRITHKHADAAHRIRGIVSGILHDLGLFNDVISLGLEYNAGVGGKRLTAGQRQKLNLARALLKNADFLILNRPLTAIDPQTQKIIIRNVLERTAKADPRPAVVWLLSSPELAGLFERVVVFDRGTLAGDGTYKVLAEGNGAFQRLLS